MLKFRKTRQVSRYKGRRSKTTEPDRGTTRRLKLGRRHLLWIMFGILLAAAVAMGVWLRPVRHPDRTASPKGVDETVVGIEAAEKVARAFLIETDPTKRLSWVRHAEEVKSRLMEYPEEARTMPGKIEELLGHQTDGGRSLTGFVVAFPAGNMRLLEVVGTSDGPRVDWDAYARYGTAGWEDLWSGKAQRAVVRVFCEPATERPKPFEDQGKWTSFRLSSPDLPQAILGFAAVASVREERMKQVILATPNYRQRFTLEIVRHEGKDEPLFEIARCLAVGWVRNDQAVEELWGELLD